MKIISLFIDNFRGINGLEITDFSTNTLIIGKNGSGKTNICYAIRKVLDFNIRRMPFDEADSSDSNKKDIRIKMVLSTEGITIDNRSVLGAYIDRDNSITVELIAKYNEDIMLYEENLHFNRTDPREYPTNRTTPIDKVIDLIYVNPSYNLTEDKNQFFKFRSKEDKENNIGPSDNIVEVVQVLNDVISEEKVAKEISASINNQPEFREIFEGLKFKAQSNIIPTNIYGALEVVPYDDKNPRYNNIGDGKNKTLSLLLKSISKNPNKEKIFVIEEPENHLFPQLQRTYSRLIDSLKFGQIIVTTHSPSIIDFNKMKTIIKLHRDNGNVKYKSLNFAEDDYGKYGHMLNEDFAQMLFHDKVLLVEGVSEKYFYNRLMIEEETFLNFCTKNNLGIFCVYGIDFPTYKNFLNRLDITVFVKTDNDIFKVQNKTPLTYRYAGISRVLEYLDNNGLSKLETILGVTKFDPKNSLYFSDRNTKNTKIEKGGDAIQKLFMQYGVFISKHNQGFEKDFLDYVGKYTVENLGTLKAAKLKNLHSFIQENKISLKITEENKNSILLGFMYV